MNWLFDNNLSPDIAQALRVVGKNVAHVKDIQELGGGALDQQIIQYAAPRDICVVTVDHAMRRASWFVHDVRTLKAGVFLVNIGKARQLRAWPIVKLMFKAWDNMEEFRGKNAFPFVALVKHNGTVVKFH